jgi:hypothetical protein
MKNINFSDATIYSVFAAIWLTIRICNNNNTKTIMRTGKRKTTNKTSRFVS